MWNPTIALNSVPWNGEAHVEVAGYLNQHAMEIGNEKDDALTFKKWFTTELKRLSKQKLLVCRASPCKEKTVACCPLIFSSQKLAVTTGLLLLFLLLVSYTCWKFIQTCRTMQSPEAQRIHLQHCCIVQVSRGNDGDRERCF